MPDIFSDMSTIVMVGLCVIAVASIFVAVLAGSSKKPAAKGVTSIEPGTYVSQQQLMSPPELHAMVYLRDLIGDSGYVCPKVRIADIVKTAPNLDRKTWARAFGAISQKHVDFVVTDINGGIRFAVEVDDKSHQRKDRQKRDLLVNEIFAQAEITLVRVLPRKLERSDELQFAITTLKNLRINPSHAA